MAWNVQNDMPSGNARCENLSSDESGKCTATSGRYLKPPSNARFRTNAGGQRSGRRFSPQPLAHEEVHDRGSQKNSRKPSPPGQVERVACQQKKRLPHASRPDLGEDHRAEPERTDSTRWLGTTFLRDGSEPKELNDRRCVALVTENTSNSSPVTITDLNAMSVFRNLIDALDAAPASRPFVTAWIDEDEQQTVTFGEFRGRVRSQAAISP